MELKELVKDKRMAIFECYRNETLYYSLTTEDGTYQFPIPIEDMKGTTINREEKALHLMRWIRQSLENDTFEKVA